jgi:hypothetical protein
MIKKLFFSLKNDLITPQNPCSNLAIKNTKNKIFFFFSNINRSLLLFFFINNFFYV